MPVPQIILALIERFERNLAAYKSGSYNETQVRHEFIDPFFEALGWDVNNQTGNAEAYKDVIHEDAVKVSGMKVKSETIRKHYSRYNSWWLVLVDSIAYGFNEAEQKEIKSMIRINSIWDKVIVLNSLKGNNILEF